MATEETVSQEVEMANKTEDEEKVTNTADTSAQDEMEVEDEEEALAGATNSNTSKQFDEAIAELKEMPRFKNFDHVFKQGPVDASRRGFEFILIWFGILLLVWDIAIPYGAIKTAYWTDDDQALCEGCNASCKAYGDQGFFYDSDCRPTERPYGDTPFFFNPQFRQEFGVYWIVFISFHVGAAWIAFPSYILQLFFTERGRKFHKFCGIFILFVVMILWSFGGVAAAILVFYRGFHPCAFVIKDYNNPSGYGWVSGETSASSFSFYLYLQFAYDGALLNECLMHGIAARLLAGMSFDPNYPYVAESGVILKKWQANILGMLYYMLSGVLR